MNSRIYAVFALLFSLLGLAGPALSQSPPKRPLVVEPEPANRGTEVDDYVTKIMARAAEDPTYPKAKNPLFVRYEEDCRAAVERRLKAIDELVARKKSGVPRFTSIVMNGGAKAKMVGSLAESWIDGLARAVGSGGPKRPDAFRGFVADAFRREVLSADEVEAAVRGAVRGWIADWKALDARLLVDLRADVDQKALPINEAGIGRLARSQAAAVDALVTRSLDAACVDLVETLVRVSIDYAIGEAVANRISSPEDDFAKRLAIGAGVGAGVDTVLRNIPGAGGEAALAAKVNEALDRLSRAIIEGGEVTPGLKDHLKLLCDDHIRMRRKSLWRIVDAPAAGR
ncbi:MAG: hypothetical protein U0835_00610 [Isosphaeraceae bacterium]